MSRSLHRLTALDVKNLAKPGLHSDGGSLYLNLGANGRKSWRIVYVRNRKRVELGIGSVATVTLAEAREKAAEARKLLQDGADPKQEWSSQKPAKNRNFGAIAIEHIEAHEPAWKNAKHRQQWRNTLATYASALWEMPVNQITVDDILAILKPIWSTKPETASRVRGRIESVLDAAKVRGLRSGENPAAWRGKKSRPCPRGRRVPSAIIQRCLFVDVPKFFGSLQGCQRLSARALGTLPTPTAARTSEVLQARWSEVQPHGNALGRSRRTV